MSIYPLLTRLLNWNRKTLATITDFNGCTCHHNTRVQTIFAAVLVRGESSTRIWVKFGIRIPSNRSYLWAIPLGRLLNV